MALAVKKGAGQTLPERISLIGFMGAGKTTVGRMLARRIGYEFYDLDQLIEKKQGQTIKAIFARQGEGYFRRLETETLNSLVSCPRVVIATGGGACARSENRRFFRQDSFTVYLEVSFPGFLKRTAGDPVRPLLRKTVEELKELYSQRLTAYRGSGITVTTDGKAPRQITAEVLRLLTIGA